MLRRLRVPEERLTILGNGIDLEPIRSRARDRRRRRGRARGARSDADGRRRRRRRRPAGAREGLSASCSKPRPSYGALPAQVRVAVDRPRRTATRPTALTTDDRALAAAAQACASSATATTSCGSTRAMDVLVLASHREGFPRAPMEAAAMGVPVVATDIRGCRQAVDHGVTGLLVPPRDPDALADAIATLATDRELAARMGAAAQAKAKRDFDQQRCIDLTISTYRGCSNGRDGRVRTAVGDDADIRARPCRRRDAGASRRCTRTRIAEGFLVDARTAVPPPALPPRCVRSRARIVLVVADDRLDGVAGFVAVAEGHRPLLPRLPPPRRARRPRLAAAPALLRAPRNGVGDLPLRHGSRRRPARGGGAGDRGRARRRRSRPRWRAARTPRSPSSDGTRSTRRAS